MKINWTAIIVALIGLCTTVVPLLLANNQVGSKNIAIAQHQLDSLRIQVLADSIAALRTRIDSITSHRVHRGPKGTSPYMRFTPSDAIEGVRSVVPDSSVKIVKAPLQQFFSAPGKK